MPPITSMSTEDIDEDDAFSRESSDTESQVELDDAANGGADTETSNLLGVGKALLQEGPSISPADVRATIAAQDCSTASRTLLYKLPEARGIVRDICARPSFRRASARRHFNNVDMWRRSFEHWGPLLSSLINTSKIALLWALSFNEETSTPERAYHDRPATDPLLRRTLHARVSTDRLHDVHLTEAENVLFSLVDDASNAAMSESMLNLFEGVLLQGVVTDLWQHRPPEYEQVASAYWCGLLDGLPEILSAHKNAHGTASVAAYRHFFDQPEKLVNLLSHFAFPDDENRRAIPILADYRIPWMSPPVLSRILRLFSSTALRPAERAFRGMVANIVPAGDLYWSYFRDADVEEIPASATSPVAVLEEYIFQMVVRRAGQRPVRRDTSDMRKYRKMASALALQIADMVLMASHRFPPAWVRDMGRLLRAAVREFNSLSDDHESIDALQAFAEVWTYCSSSLSSALHSDADVSIWHVPTIDNFVQEYWLKYARETGQSFINSAQPLPFIVDPNGNTCTAAAARRLTEFPADWMLVTDGMGPDARKEWLVTVARMAYSAGQRRNVLAVGQAVAGAMPQSMYYRILGVLRKPRVLGPAYKPWAMEVVKLLAALDSGHCIESWDELTDAVNAFSTEDV